MSGHSKWATIKRKKGAMDAKRSQVFTKLIKELMVCARMGGSNPESNARLKMAILRAKMANMPKDNIDRAIKKGAGELQGQEYVELTYEAYAPGGVAILIEVLTDNKNRTASDVRGILNKGQASLVSVGSVTRLFERKGLIIFDNEKYQENQIMEIAVEAGAEEVKEMGTCIEVTSSTEDFITILEAFHQAELQTEVAEISLVPMALVTLEKEATEKVVVTLDRLEANDDVQNVYHNLDTTVLESHKE